MKRLFQITITIGATLLGIFLLWVFGPAVSLFAGSLAVSAALRPLVARLEARGVGRGAAILLCYVALIAAIGLFLFFGGLQIVSDTSAAAERLPKAYTELRGSWANGSALQRDVARGLPEDLNALLTGGEGGALVSGAAIVGIAGNLLADAIFVLGMLSLAFYWLTEVTRFERLWLSLLPVDLRIRAREIWRNTEAAVGAYIRATFISTVLAGVWLYLLFAVLRLPFATTLALVGGLSHLVPRIGPALGLLPALLIALSISPLEAVVVLFGGALIQITIHQLGEYLMRTGSIKVNPLLQVLVLVALAEVGGLWAMIFAPPLAALIQVLYANLLNTSSTSQPTESAFELLCQRLDRLKESVAPENKELNSALQRSDDLILQARDLLNK